MITLKIGEQFFTLNEGDVQISLRRSRLRSNNPALLYPSTAAS
ncbi:TPA: hypothetical protein ACVH97_003542 [Yersinia enterocolitica]